MAQGQIHLGPQGPVPCSADPSKPNARGCPYEADGHYDTPKEAEQAYEAKMGGNLAEPVSKKPEAPASVVELSDSEQAVLDVYSEYIDEESIEIYDHSGLSDEEILTLAELRDNPDLLANNCYSVSSVLAQELSSPDEEVGVISIAYRDKHSHHAVSIRNADGEEVILDYTAAQYDNSLPIPFLANRARWKATIADRVAKKHGTSIAYIGLESDGALPNPDTIPERFYHVASRTNLEAITEEGLAPRVGERSARLGEAESRIYLFDSQASAEDALGSWLGDEYDDEDELVLLSTDASNVQTAKPSFEDDEDGVSWEWTTKYKIPGNELKVEDLEI